MLKALDGEKKTARASLSPELRKYVEEVISSGQSSDGDSKKQESVDSSKQFSTSRALLAQVYNPQFWNNSSSVRINNCYNYASNSRTNTFAQPGRANGCSFEMNCRQRGGCGRLRWNGNRKSRR